MTRSVQERQDTEALALRFMYVIEEAFKRLSESSTPMPSAMKELNFNQIRALHILHRQPGLVQKNLADGLRITPAAISTAVREMVTMGLIERRSDPNDARLMRLYLSDSADDMIRRAQLARVGAVANLLQALPYDEQLHIVVALEAALEAHSNANNSPAGPC
ncbi:MAG: MarR family transcriptional regulator [Anaerolineae bacterium]|nr:MarR family transcriptional regulator [Anaerolineae bacterium]